jgi:antitoxin component YwqK of YwqJK toxin-antitoxin module
MNYGKTLTTQRSVWGLGHLLGLSTCLASCAVLPPGHPRNHLDAEGKRHGRWREYFDVAETQIANQGRYRHGRPVGQWWYFAPGRKLEHTERYLRFPTHHIRLTYYHPNGQVAKSGQARYVLHADGGRFYWFGEWKQYTESGKLLPSEYYLDGLLQQ